MKQKFSNKEIFNIAQLLYSNFVETENFFLPIKANFILQKNIKLFIDEAQLIENMRQSIAKKYGYYDDENNQYIINKENIQEANEEINKLFEIEQILDISLFSIEDLENCEISTKQMQALFFMIEEE